MWTIKVEKEFYATHKVPDKPSSKDMHGNYYRVEAYFTGLELNKKSNVLANLEGLEDLLETTLQKELNFKQLEKIMNPTVEKIAEFIYRRIENYLEKMETVDKDILNFANVVKLRKIRVYLNSRTYIEYER